MIRKRYSVPVVLCIITLITSSNFEFWMNLRRLPFIFQGLTPSCLMLRNFGCDGACTQKPWSETTCCSPFTLKVPGNPFVYLYAEHLGVLKNLLTHIRVFQIELEFERVGFWEEWKTGTQGEKLLGVRDRTNNKLNPRMAKCMALDAKTRTRATLTGGECPHHCATLTL